jgi:hypothetical protein
MRVRESRRVRWVNERQRVGVGDAPLSVSDYLRLCREDDDYELLDGVLVRRMAAQLPHEWLFQWMLRLVGGYVEARGLGVVLGSRTPVQITPYRVRLPDLLFVPTERMPILNPQALLEPPDWVMEIPSGRRASVGLGALGERLPHNRRARNLDGGFASPACTRPAPARGRLHDRRGKRGAVALGGD